MKVLLDENLTHRLRKNLGADEVFTVSYKGWSGLKNGELLRTAEKDGIEVFLTGDQTLTHDKILPGAALQSWRCPLSSGTFSSTTCR